jgi:hypothetical protein
VRLGCKEASVAAPALAAAPSCAAVVLLEAHVSRLGDHEELLGVALQTTHSAAAAAAADDDGNSVLGMRNALRDACCTSDKGARFTANKVLGAHLCCRCSAALLCVDCCSAQLPGRPPRHPAIRCEQHIVTGSIQKHLLLRSEQPSGKQRLLKADCRWLLLRHGKAPCTPQ